MIKARHCLKNRDLYTTRNQARESAHARSLLATSALGIFIGAGLAFWLPHRVPETQGSPASLVAIVVLWVIGGGIIFLSAAALVGAIMGRPEELGD